MRILKFLFSRLFLCIAVIAALVAAIIFLCLYIHSLLPAAAAIALSYTLGLISALHLLHGEAPADFKCGWLAIVALIPVGGAVIYFLSCVSKRGGKRNARIFPECGYDGCRLYTDGAEYLEDLLSAISAAERTVYLEYYIISKGDIWQGIFLELKKAIARGAEVKIVYDGLGSALRAPKKNLKELKKLGAQVKIFNKPVPLPAAKIGFRDHRKLAVIDGERVFLGGVNIADEYAHLTAPYGFWKDGGASFTGEIAKFYGEIFLSCVGGGEGAHAFLPSGSGATIICDEPDGRGSVCEDMLAEKIYSAKDRVLIFTPYLCMGDKLRDALVYAVRRGVRVKVLLPGIPDKKLPYAISRAYASKLSGEGAEIFCYSPGFMHFKGVVCDGGVFLGSYNFDFRSMRLNYENGVYLTGGVAEEVCADFEKCVALGRPFKPSRKLTAKIAQYFIGLFAPLV